MNILILAAGFGTRLKEYGEATPKGLIPTTKGTLLDHVLQECAGLQAPIALVTNEKFYPVYREWILKNYPDLNVKLINDGATAPEARLGAIGDILYVLKELSWEEDDLLVIPSDTFFGFPLTDFVTFAQEENMFATVVRDMQDKAIIANRLGCPTIKDERIIAFVEKPADPPTTVAAIPFYYYPKRILPLLSDYKRSGGNMDAPGSIIPWLLSKQQNIAAFQISSATLDVGTPADVESVHSL